jgi:hypothetical protein
MDGEAIDGCRCGACQMERADVDPAAFWRHMSPAQARALLAAAPRVAGPWELWMKRPEIWTRNTPGAPWAASVFTAGYSAVARIGWKLYERQVDHEADSIESAKSAADAALVAAGYLLDDSEAST